MYTHNIINTTVTVRRLYSNYIYSIILSWNIIGEFNCIYIYIHDVFTHLLLYL